MTSKRQINKLKALKKQAEKFSVQFNSPPPKSPDKMISFKPAKDSNCALGNLSKLY